MKDFQEYIISRYIKVGPDDNGELTIKGISLTDSDEYEIRDEAIKRGYDIKDVEKLIDQASLKLIGLSNSEKLDLYKKFNDQPEPEVVKPENTVSPKPIKPIVANTADTVVPNVSNTIIETPIPIIEGTTIDVPKPMVPPVPETDNTDGNIHLPPKEVSQKSNTKKVVSIILILLLLVASYLYFNRNLKQDFSREDISNTIKSFHRYCGSGEFDELSKIVSLPLLIDDIPFLTVSDVKDSFHLLNIQVDPELNDLVIHQKKYNESHGNFILAATYDIVNSSNKDTFNYVMLLNKNVNATNYKIRSVMSLVNLPTKPAEGPKLIKGGVKDGGGEDGHIEGGTGEIVIEGGGGTVVDGQSDKDGDGVIDMNDSCPSTAKTSIILRSGCELNPSDFFSSSKRNFQINEPIPLNASNKYRKNYVVNMGDGNVYNNKVPSAHSYSSAGKYTISLVQGTRTLDWSIYVNTAKPESLTYYFDEDGDGLGIPDKVDNFPIGTKKPRWVVENDNIVFDQCPKRAGSLATKGCPQIQIKALSNDLLINKRADVQVTTSAQLNGDKYSWSNNELDIIGNNSKKVQVASKYVGKYLITVNISNPADNYNDSHTEALFFTISKEELAGKLFDLAEYGNYVKTGLTGEIKNNRKDSEDFLKKSLQNSSITVRKKVGANYFQSSYSKFENQLLSVKRSSETAISRIRVLEIEYDLSSTGKITSFTYEIP